jgi:hypothetical protein
MSAPSGDDDGRRRFDGEGEPEEDAVVLEHRMRCLTRVAIARRRSVSGVEYVQKGEVLLVSRRLFS